jgi:putative phosphonate metabolism protein
MRYAVYAIPPANSAFSDAAAAWLGRDAFTGEGRDQPSVPGVTAERFGEITAEARRYGFHATLKPPFSLARGESESDLTDALSDFAATIPPPVVALRVGRIDGFLAIMPDGRPAELHRLADRAVTGLDRFRAPAPPDETARRRAVGLSPGQETNLQRWGYPYVLDEYRFHMTLSARLAGTEADCVEDAARAWFAPHLAAPVTLDTLALFVEPAPRAAFRIRETFTLSPAGAETR